jgi:hypothetical protein
VSEAADALGISEDAVRSRIKRGTLTSVRDGGRVFVLLVGRDRPTDQPGESNALTSQMQGEIDHLRSQLDQERQAHAEARRIIAGLVDRMPPAIEAPSDATESPEEAQGRGEPRPDAPGAREGARRPWWRRVFGG